MEVKPCLNYFLSSSLKGIFCFALSSATVKVSTFKPKTKTINLVCRVLATVFIMTKCADLGMVLDSLLRLSMCIAVMMYGSCSLWILAVLSLRRTERQAMQVVWKNQSIEEKKLSRQRNRQIFSQAGRQIICGLKGGECHWSPGGQYNTGPSAMLHTHRHTHAGVGPLGVVLNRV